MALELGGSKGSNKTSSKGSYTGSTTNTLDPRLEDALYGFLGDVRGGARPYTPISGPLVAGFTQDQINAQDQARTFAGAGVGQDLVRQAATAAGGAAGYTPQMVSGGKYGAASVNPASINRGAIRDVSSANITGDDIARFMNPYQDQVVSRSTANLEQARDREQADNSAFATKMNAFRGTGLFNARDRTTEKFADAIGDTTANLNYQGFNTALGGAQTDAARALQAQLSNQGIDYGVAGQNAGFQQQAAIDNAGRTDAASQFGLNQAMQAGLANQGAAAQGAGINLAGAGALSGLGGQLRDMGLGDINILGGVGDAQQALTQAEIDAAKGENDKTYGSQFDIYNAIGSALGLIPQTGTTTASGTQTNNSNSKSKGTGFGFAKG